MDTPTTGPNPTEDTPSGAAKSTRIDVDVSAGTVQGGGRVTGVDIGAIQGPVSITIGPAADPDARRRAASEMLRQPQPALHPFEPHTIYIPAGPFRMGTDDPALPHAEQPRHIVSLPEFRIGRHPVTVREYAAFVRERRDRPAPKDWFNREPPAGRAEHPVTHVSWHDALAYCAWLRDKTQRGYTLPSEAEWEKAAASSPSGDGVVAAVVTRFPWGDDWTEGLCNIRGSDTNPVTAHPAGASAFGVEELLGNVQEWTRSLWGGRPAETDYGYPYDPADGREVGFPGELPAQVWLVHRGGSYRSRPDEVRCTSRGSAPPDSKIAWRGFRVAMAI